MAELDPFYFFPDETFPLVVECQNVFEILNDLSQFISARLSPNVESLVGFVDKTHVYVDGKWLDSGFRLAENGSKPVVEVEGQRRPDAVLVQAGAFFHDAEIELSSGVVVESGAFLRGPTFVGPNSQVRQGAYIRGHCFFYGNCVIGHATEVKHSLFLSGAKAGHFAYVGDSILGREVNLGAGTKLANLRFDNSSVKIKIGDDLIDTGRRKLGAVLGNGVQTGCNSVTNPGTLIVPGARVPGCAIVGPGLFRPVG